MFVDAFWWETLLKKSALLYYLKFTLPTPKWPQWPWDHFMVNLVCLGTPLFSFFICKRLVSWGFEEMWGSCPQETIVILFKETTPLLCLLAWLAWLACFGSTENVPLGTVHFKGILQHEAPACLSMSLWTAIRTPFAPRIDIVFGLLQLMILIIKSVS